MPFADQDLENALIGVLFCHYSVTNVAMIYNIPRQTVVRMVKRLRELNGK